MPNRIIREGILSSPRINALSPAAEIFYRRLLNVVDDYGRFHGSPGTLRGACWPTNPDRFSDDEVSDFLLECLKPDSKDRRLIWLYESDGCMFLQVVDFRQQCRSKSKFPEPDINCLANAEQLLITRRRRFPYSEAYAHRAPEPIADSKPCAPANGNGDGNIGLAELASALIDEHPRACTRALVEHALVNAATKKPDLSKLRACHVAWCKTANWTEKNGRFAPKLEVWIQDEGYLKWPTEIPADAEKRTTFKELFGNTPGVAGG